MILEALWTEVVLVSVEKMTSTEKLVEKILVASIQFPMNSYTQQTFSFSLRLTMDDQFLPH